MRKLIFALNASLDGFMEDRNGGLDWSNPSEELHRHFNELDRTLGTHLYGRGLYENMSAFWPTAEEDPSAPEFVKEYARIWKEMPKVVFSTTLSQVGWNSRLIKEDLAGEVNRLKAQPGNDMSVGGAGLAASMMKLGLIDEFWIYVHPVILGGGKPMFPELNQSISLELIDTHRFEQGVVQLKYRRV